MVDLWEVDVFGWQFMILRFSVFTILFLGACVSGTDAPSFAHQPRDDAPTVRTPTPIISQREFLDTFANLCLVSPSNLSDFKKTAKHFGLTQTSGADSFGNSYYTWKAPKDGTSRALEFSVGSGYILWDLVGNETDLPSETWKCSLTAYLVENDTHSQSALTKVVMEDFQPIAKSLDFSRSSKDYQVKPDDIELKLVLSGKGSHIDMRPGSSCPLDDPCWSVSPYKLTLDVVTERFP